MMSPRAAAHGSMRVLLCLSGSADSCRAARWLLAVSTDVSGQVPRPLGFRGWCAWFSTDRAKIGTWAGAIPAKGRGPGKVPPKDWDTGLRTIRARSHLRPESTPSRDGSCCGMDLVLEFPAHGAQSSILCSTRAWIRNAQSPLLMRISNIHRVCADHSPFTLPPPFNRFKCQIGRNRRTWTPEVRSNRQRAGGNRQESTLESKICKEPQAKAPSPEASNRPSRLCALV